MHLVQENVEWIDEAVQFEVYVAALRVDDLLGVNDVQPRDDQTITVGDVRFRLSQGNQCPHRGRPAGGRSRRGGVHDQKVEHRAIVISGPRASVRVDTEASTHVDTRRDERKCLGARDFGVISPHGLGLGVNAR